MTDIFLKDTDSVLDYKIDWSTWLGNDTISTSEWIVPSGIDEESNSNTDTDATIWISGGTSGHTYELVNRITTPTRTVDRSIFIECKFNTTFINHRDLKREMGIDNEQDDALLSHMASSVESMWDMLTNKTWVSTTVTEIYDGPESSRLFLDNYPVTSVSVVSDSKTGAIQITNSNKYTYATVSVDSESIVLNYNGSGTSLAKSDHTTVTAIVDAINAVGDGWSASIVGDYASVISSSLLETSGQNCINSHIVDLYIPDEFLEGFTLDKEIGCLYNPKGWVVGKQNIYVTYTSGYTSSTLPYRIKQLLIRQACHWYRQAKGKNWDYSSIDKVEGGTLSFKKVDDYNLLPDFVKFADMNRKVNV
jgi:hypothetical protein